MSRYASNTSVPVAKSKAEIEAILERYGADQFFSGWSANNAVIGFTMPVGGGEYRQIKFVITMPEKSERRFTHHSKGSRTTDAALKEWEQACRQRWRALALVIKAKLEAVESGISVFENEFLANIVLSDGKTVGERVKDTIALEYKSNSVQPLLPGPSA